jgi:AcrR family transcriptional regulator
MNAETSAITAKGARTRGSIIEEAVRAASVGGIESLSIGALANRLKISKSGLFAHFGSRESLQLAVLQEAVERVTNEAIRPALKEPRGLPRLTRFMENWIGWPERARLPGGCPFIAAALELDDRPGELRDFVADKSRELVGTIERLIRDAIETGELRRDIDVSQLAFELHGIAYGHIVWSRLLDRKGSRTRALTAFHKLIEKHRSPSG